MTDVWLLHSRDEVVAELHVTEGDFPWLSGRVVTHEGFAALAPLFADEVRLLNELTDEETPEWTAAYDEIRARTVLTNPAGIPVPEYLLHIEGEDAWWRWSDEPFDD